MSNREHLVSQHTPQNSTRSFIVDINNEVEARVIRSKEKLNLDEMLDLINDKNIHSGFSIGMIEGDEIW